MIYIYFKERNILQKKKEKKNLKVEEIEQQKRRKANINFYKIHKYFIHFYFICNE